MVGRAEAVAVKVAETAGWTPVGAHSVSLCEPAGDDLLMPKHHLVVVQGDAEAGLGRWLREVFVVQSASRHAGVVQPLGVVARCVLQPASDPLAKHHSHPPIALTVCVLVVLVLLVGAGRALGLGL